MSDTRPHRTLLKAFTLSVAFCGLEIVSAHATSVTRSGVPAPKICVTEARFIKAVPRDGKAVWVFERLTAENSKPCQNLAKNFEVWVWSGSYSTLSQSLVYPMYLTEPKPGSELSLKIEYRSVRESLSRSTLAKHAIEGWFLAADETGAGTLRK